MRKASLNTKGFGIAKILLIVLAISVVGGAGAYEYHRDHRVKPASTTNTDAKATDQAERYSPESSLVVYAGWRSYCDPIYRYCFKYPANWTITASSAGGNGSVSIVDPAKTVQVSYAIGNTGNGGTAAFTPTYIGNISATAGQDVTVVGGYYGPSGEMVSSGMVGNFVPSYSVVDSSILTTFSLRDGFQSQFIGSPVFTDVWSSTQPLGSMVSQPVVRIDTAAAARAWLQSADAKISLNILQSLSYQG